MKMHLGYGLFLYINFEYVTKSETIIQTMSIPNKLNYLKFYFRINIGTIKYFV